MNEQNQGHDITQELSINVFVKSCVDVITDFFPSAPVNPNTANIISKEISKWNNPFLEQFFVPCVMHYPYGLEALRKVSSAILNSALDIVKDDKEYYSLTYFAIGKVYLYYGFVEKAYECFFKYLELLTKNKDLVRKHRDIVQYLSFINEIMEYSNFDDLNDKLFDMLEKVQDILDEMMEKLDIWEKLPSRPISEQGAMIAVVLDILSAFFNYKIDFSKAVKEIMKNAFLIMDPAFLKDLGILVDFAENVRRYRMELESDDIFKRGGIILKKIAAGKSISDEEEIMLKKLNEYFTEEDLVVFLAFLFANLAVITPFFIRKKDLDIILLAAFVAYPYDETLALAGAYHVARLKKSACIQYLAGVYYYYKRNFKKAIKHLENALKLKFNKVYPYRILIKTYILKKPTPNYLEKVFQYINEMIKVTNNVEDAYFIIGAEIMCNVNPKMLRNTIAKIIKETGIEDERLLRIYKSLENIEAQICTIIRESVTFIDEYNAI